MGKVIPISAKAGTGRPARQGNERAGLDPPKRPIIRAKWLWWPISSGLKALLTVFRWIAGSLIEAVAQLLSILRRPVRFICSIASVAMLVSLYIQWANGWPEPRIIVFSVAVLVLCPGLAANYDRLVTFLFLSVRRLRAGSQDEQF